MTVSRETWVTPEFGHEFLVSISTLRWTHEVLLQKVCRLYRQSLSKYGCVYGRGSGACAASRVWTFPQETRPVPSLGFLISEFLNKVF